MTGESYIYCGNNPINRIDPTGMDWYSNNETGKYEFFEGSRERDGYKHIGASGTYKDKDGYQVNLFTNTKGQGDWYYDGTGSRDKPTYNPKTIEKNIAGLTYPGGENPKNISTNGKLPEDDFSYVPSLRSEYPAIGHDRRYDKLKIAGLSGLLFDARAIPTDDVFVMQELSVAFGSKKTSFSDRATALGLGVGLGLLSSSKRMSTILLTGLNYPAFWIHYYQKAGGDAVTNIPTGANQKEMNRKLKLGLK